MSFVCIVWFGWYFIILGEAADRSSSTESTILEKQHDYYLKFERIEAVRYDRRYIKSLDARTFKYNRTSAVVNASVTFKYDTGADLEVVCQGYRFASNEYRDFPMRFQFNFCEAVRRNSMGIGDFRKCGTFSQCPLIKDKTYTICNWAPDQSKFPSFIPNGEYMVEVEARYRSVEMFVVRTYATITRPVSHLG